MMARQHTSGIDFGHIAQVVGEFHVRGTEFLKWYIDKYWEVS